MSLQQTYVRMFEFIQHFQLISNDLTETLEVTGGKSLTQNTSKFMVLRLSLQYQHLLISSNCNSKLVGTEKIAAKRILQSLHQVTATSRYSRPSRRRIAYFTD